VAKADADAAKVASEKAVQTALAMLDEIKKGAGTPHGKIFWMERELAEKKRFMGRGAGA